VIWAILIAVGVPLWFCAAAIIVIVLRNRALRRRPGNVPVRVRRPGKERWVPGHGVWAHDVFAFRGSPAAWKEALLWVTGATVRPADDAEQGRLHRIGDRPVIATFALAAGGSIEFAASREDRDALLGPFVDAEASPAAPQESTPAPSSAR
jgi:hypothetical protein